MAYAPPGLCRHCGFRVVQPDRNGLCMTCHRRGKSKLYQPKTRRGNRGVKDSEGERPTPPIPTNLPPGPAKVAVLTERAAFGLSLFSTRDAYIDSNGMLDRMEEVDA